MKKTTKTRTHLTFISFVFSLYIINDFEKQSSPISISLSLNRTVAHHKVRLPHFILQEYQKRNSPLNVGIFQNTTPETTIHQR